MFTKLISRVKEIGINPKNGINVIKSIGKSIWVKNSVLKIVTKLGLFLSIIKLNNSKHIKSKSDLVESESRYRRLFESARDGILILDAESGMIDDVNPYLIELLGYSKEKFIQKRIWELGLFKDIIENKEKFLELQKLEYVRYDDLPLKSSDGREIHVEFVSNVYLVNGKKVIQCNIRNITERKEAERYIKILSSRNSAILESVPDIIMEVDENQIYTWANKAGYQYFGDDVIGKNAHDYFHGQQDEFQSLEILFKGGEDILFIESLQKRQDGEVRLLVWWCKVLKDADGKIIGALSTARDITEGRESEKALEHAYMELETLHNNLDEAVFTVDMILNKIIYASVSHQTIFGYPSEDFLSNSQLWLEIIVEEDKPIIAAGYPVLLSGENLRHEYRINHSDGTIRWIEAKLKPTLDEYGKLVRLDGIASDITAQKHIQNEIKFQSDLLNNVGQAVIATNMLGEVIYWNTAAEKIYGWTSSEAIGQNIVSLTPAEQTKEQAVEIMHELSEGKSWSGEFLVNGKVGKSFPCYVTDTPIFDSNSILIGIIGISSDITDRKLTEEKLMETEGKFRSYIEYSPVGIFIVDETGKYIDCNPSAQNMLGYTREELCKLTIIETLPFDQIEKGLQNFKLVMEFGFDKIEIELLKKDSGRVPVLLEAVQLPQKNRFMAFCTDITERKITEKELLISKAKSEESDKLKTAFLQNMSHEIRTPLNGIIGFSNLLSMPDLSPDDLKEFTDMIKISGNRLIEIVNNVLDISKIQTGQVRIEKNEVDINSIFSELLVFFSHLEKEKNLILNFANQNNTNINLFTDEIKLNQILINLINNAVKFTKTGSIDFGYEIQGNVIQFFVRDTGIGIRPEMHDLIFERFIQADSAISRGYEGAGIGLAICKGLVELLGGKIWVESELGKGTTFYFTLPFNHAEQSSIEEPIYPNIKEKKVTGKILLAEDDWVSSQYIKRILTKAGVVVIHAENGKEAVEIVENTPDIDLILMDIKMPVMDGIEATKLIKKFRPELPIIAQTAYAFTEEKKKILSIGCNDYLSKPIEEHKLNIIINKYLK